MASDHTYVFRHDFVLSSNSQLTYMCSGIIPAWITQDAQETEQVDEDNEEEIGS
jgi:hypothetical protein